MTSPVIDLSHWNPEPDWPTVRKAGVMGAMLKCTEGTGYVDPTYGKRVNSAAQAGILTCPYHYLKPGNIAKQMDWFLSRCFPPGGGRVVLDHEDKATLDELCEAVEYIGQVRPDVQVTIYSGSLIKDQLGDDVRASLDKTSLWIAHYTSASAPSWPKQQWPNWSLWQWTDKEDVPGISAPVDGNKWNGTEQNLVAWLSPAKPDPNWQPVPTAPLPISLTVPPGTPVYINGRLAEY